MRSPRVPKPRGVESEAIASSVSRRSLSSAWARSLRARSTIESPIRRFATSTAMTVTSTRSPTDTTWRACATRRSSAMRETCTSPSIPGASSTKAPKASTLRTVPVTAAPTAKRSAAEAQGSGARARSESPMRARRPSAAGSSFTICASTCWPTASTSEGCAARWCPSSLTWIRPSTPPRSANAPKSRSDVTVARTVRPTASSFHVAAARAASSSASRSRRETTTLRPPASMRVTRNRSRWPTYVAGSPRRRSICDAGQKARTPATWTSKPPLFCPVTTPSTGMPCASACSSSPGTWPPRPRVRLSSTEPERLPSSVTVASISSPTLSAIDPSAARNSSRASTAPAWPPSATHASGVPIPTTRPRRPSPSRMRAPEVTRPSLSARSRANSSSSAIGSLVGTRSVLRQRRPHGVALRAYRATMFLHVAFRTSTRPRAPARPAIRRPVPFRRRWRFPDRGLWGRVAIEITSLTAVILLGVLAGLGAMARSVLDVDGFAALIPFATTVVALGFLTMIGLRLWLRVRMWLVRRAKAAPAVLAMLLAAAVAALATQPAYRQDIATLRILVGGHREAARATIAHQVFAAYRRQDRAALTRVLERARVYEPTVFEAAAAFDVDPEVLMGVGFAESSFSPRDSADGGRGLFQITSPPADAVADARRALGADMLDPLNQRHNAFLAAATLRRYLDEMHGDPFLGLLAYNIGPRNGGLRTIMTQYGAHDFTTIQPYLRDLPRDYPIRVLSGALAYRVWRREGQLLRYEDGDNAIRIQAIGIPGLTSASS